MKVIMIFILIILLISCDSPNDVNFDNFDNEIEFTLDGGGFDKVKFNFSTYKNTRMNWARYDSSLGITYMNITNGNLDYSSVSNISISFKGKEPGYYSNDYLDNGIDMILHINKDSVFYGSSIADSSSGGITVDEYSEIGGDIKGTFSCVVIDRVKYDQTERIKVEGKFRVLRLAPVYAFWRE